MVEESSPDVIEIDDDGVTMQWKPPASTGKKAMQLLNLLTVKLEESLLQMPCQAIKEYVVHMKALAVFPLKPS